MGEAAKKEEEPLVVVGPGASDLPDSQAPVKSEDQDGTPPADERLGGGREEQEDRPRETSRERRERQKRSRERERIEREFLRARNEELEKRVMRLEGRSTQQETAATEQRVNALRTQISNAGRVITDSITAIASGDKDAKNHLEQAQQIRDELQRELNKLEFAQEQTTRRAAAPQTAPQALPPDPAMVSLAQRWSRAHPWFDARGGDEDSDLVLAIDARLEREGYDPRDEEYWEELTSRVKRRLPEHFKANGNRSPEEDEGLEDEEELDRQPRQQSRPKGPRFSSGGRERPLRKGEVYVSAERKQAMQLAGAWDDPVVRQRLLRRYADMDAQLASEDAANRRGSP